MTAAAKASYLALDLGASSCRAVVGTLDGSAMHMQEVHRFRTPLRETTGHLYWDLAALWSDVRAGICAAARAAPLRAVAVDSWGVDYVPLGENGEPLRDAYAYRDPRTHGRLDEAVQRIPGGADALYDRTGIQFLEINTLPQIVADLALEPELVTRTSARLLIADYLLYKLSGVAIAERTLASTTQLADARAGAATWAKDVIRAIGDDPARWPRIVSPGTVLGHMLPSVAQELFPEGGAPLIVASCSHDTAAAVAATPADGSLPWAYISLGTWSLVGVELREPVLAREARLAGFTNETGLGDTVRFLKNRTGMWALEECMREWTDADETVTYETLLAEADAAPSVGTIDLNTPSFGERGGMPAKIRDSCRAAGIGEPTTRGSVVRVIIDSIARSSREALEQCDRLIGQRAQVLHVVGGGSRHELLNRLTATACGRRIIAGPEEATALGNLLVQARALGDLPAGTSVRQAARNSASLREYSPLFREQPGPRSLRSLGMTG